MTIPTPAEVAALVEQGPPAAQVDGDEPTHLPEGDDPSKGLIEARDRYRAERDQATTERDALAARVTGYQRSEVERLAGERLAHPSDVFTLSGNDVADYLDDDGNVDPDKVAADVAAILTERPGLVKRSPYSDPSQGLGGSNPKSQPSWGDVFASE